ncbi:hypothetical protein ACFLS4_03680 [Bacteroidota bacterium]
MEAILFYLASTFTIIWGVAHLFPTKNVVEEFGDISKDNKHIITMEWINEGATLIFLGVLTAIVTFINPNSYISIVVYWLVAVMLFVLAIISLFTGFKIKFLPFKLCPVIFSISAILIIIGIIL